MKHVFILWAALLAISSVQAQNAPSKFGEISKENLAMTTYDRDTTAGAVVLMDWGYVTFDYNFEVAFEHHIRIKILNSTQFDLANIGIPYYRRDRVERLKAATYNLENGKVVSYELDKKDIYTENVSEYTQKLNFSLKNVREGSIIEYTYRVNYGSYQQIMPWYFQREIPVMHSEYLVELPEAFEYKRIMRGYVPLQDAQISKRNVNFQGTPLTLTTQHYIAKHIPAFKEEPYLTTKEDYISKISFELYAISIPGQTYSRRMPDSYGELAYNLAKSEDFGKRMERGRFLKEEVDKIVSGITGDLEKAKAIYSFVQKEFKVDNDFEEENYKKIFDERRGYSSDINFILIMMLKEAGIETEPVVISTRKHGLVHPIYPSLRNFNYILALATIGEETFLLDASDKLLPFNSIGEKCLNGRGLVVSETNPRWVDLKPSFNNMKMTTASCKILPDGMLEADLKVDRIGYLAMDFRKDRKDDDSKEDYTKAFKEEHAELQLSEHQIEGLENIQGGVTEKIKVKMNVEVLGENIYLSPVLVDRVETNPFKSTERVYPVNFGAGLKEIMSFTYEIPEGYMVDEVPAPVAMALPENAGKFLFNVKVMENMIMVNSQISINKIEFSSEEYQYLRAFYAQIVAKQAEQIVLKKQI